MKDKLLVLKHFLFVGILFGLVVGYIFSAIINQIFGMLFYGMLGMPPQGAIYVIPLTVTSMIGIFLSIWLGCFLFKKISKKTKINKGVIANSTMFFAIFIFLLFFIRDMIPMINELASTIFTPYLRRATGANGIYVLHTFVFLLRVIGIPWGYNIISKKQIV